MVTASAPAPASTAIRERFRALLRQLSRRKMYTRLPAISCDAPATQTGSTSSPSTSGNSDRLTSRVSRLTSTRSGNSSHATNAATSSATPIQICHGARSVAIGFFSTGHHNTTEIAVMIAATAGNTCRLE